METTIPHIVLERLIRGTTLVNVLTIIGASLLIALAAQVAIPIPGSPGPLTMRPISVLLVGITLGSTRGAAAAALYLFEGASGLPVFAEGNGGILWLTAGLTAGYLYSYPFAAWLPGFHLGARLGLARGPRGRRHARSAAGDLPRRLGVARRALRRGQSVRDGHRSV